LGGFCLGYFTDGIRSQPVTSLILNQNRQYSNKEVTHETEITEFND